MDNLPHQNAPEDVQIEELLSHFKPQPSSLFYDRMSTAPWLRPIPSETSMVFPIRKPIRRLIWGFVALLLMIAMLGIAVIPPVRAIARQIFVSFVNAPSNQLEVQVTLTKPGDTFYFSDPANFPLSVREAQLQAGFALKQISLLPEGLSFVGSRYDPSYNASTILYQGNDYKLFLTQRPLGNSQDVFSIGASAPVEMVKIGDIEGEFVQGGWRATSIQPTSENETPTSTLNITAIWDNSLPQSTLRWQAAGIAYELRSMGDGSPSQLELILLANELK